MFEVSFTSNYHSYAVFVAVVHTLLVSDGSARMDNCFHTGLVCDLHTIREWEEGIRGHYGTFKREFEAAGFLDSLSEGIYTGCLPDTAGQKHSVLGQNDSVGF